MCGPYLYACTCVETWPMGDTIGGSLPMANRSMVRTTLLPPVRAGAEPLPAVPSPSKIDLYTVISNGISADFNQNRFYGSMMGSEFSMFVTPSESECASKCSSVFPHFLSFVRKQRDGAAEARVAKMLDLIYVHVQGQDGEPS